MVDSYLRGALLLGSDKIRKQCVEVKQLIQNAKRLLFLGAGGSFAACLHLAHDYSKVGKIPTECPSSPTLLTCLFNDYHKSEAYVEYLKVQLLPNDLVIVISSSGESDLTINAAQYAKSQGNKVVTISAFKEDNRLSKVGDINIHFKTDSFGVHEIFSEVIFHAILDDLVKH